MTSHRARYYFAPPKSKPLLCFETETLSRGRFVILQPPGDKAVLMTGAIAKTITGNKGDTKQNLQLTNAEWFDGSALVVALEERRNKKPAFGTQEAPIAIERVEAGQYRWAASSDAIGSFQNASAWIDSEFAFEWDLTRHQGRFHIRDSMDLRD